MKWEFIKTKEMTKQGLNKIESWLRVLGLSILAGVGVALLVHDLDADEPTMAWGWSLLARVAGAGIMYLAYRAGKALHEWGMLPTILTEEDEPDGNPKATDPQP